MQIGCEDQAVTNGWLKRTQLGRFDGLALRSVALLAVVIAIHLPLVVPGWSAHADNGPP